MSYPRTRKNCDDSSSHVYPQKFNGRVVVSRSRITHQECDKSQQPTSFQKRNEISIIETVEKLLALMSLA